MLCVFSRNVTFYSTIRVSINYEFHFLRCDSFRDDIYFLNHYGVDFPELLTEGCSH